MSDRVVIHGQTSKATLITDIPIDDKTALDVYFQHIYTEGNTLQDWKNCVDSKTMQIQHAAIWLQVGNSMLPWPAKLSPRNQMKKLLLSILKNASCPVKEVYVGAVLPRPDKEVEFEEDVKNMNMQFKHAARDVQLLKGKRMQVKIKFLPLHKLLLEEYEHFCMKTGRQASTVRIIKPVTVNFLPHGSELNAAGKYHLKSYVLRMMGLVDPRLNPWSKMRVVKEPKKVQKRKEAAWRKTRGKQDVSWQDLSSSDTDLDDEKPTPHVLFVDQAKGGSGSRVVLPPAGVKRVPNKV